MLLLSFTEIGNCHCDTVIAFFIFTVFTVFTVLDQRTAILMHYDAVVTFNGADTPINRKVFKQVVSK